MGKLTSLIVGFLVICFIAFYYISTQYAALINWIGPVTGPEIIYILGFLLLFFGSPFHYPLVLMIWILLGLVVGITSRKGLRAAGAAVSLFFLTLGFFGTVVISLFLPLITGTSSSNSPIGNIPLPPHGTSILSLTSAPVIGSFLNLLESILQNLNIFGFSPVPLSGSSQTLSGSNILGGIPIGTIVTFFVYPLVENLIIFAISASLFGTLIGKLIKRGATPKRKIQSIASIFLIVILLISSLAGFGAHEGSNSVHSGTPNPFQSGTGANEIRNLLSFSHGGISRLVIPGTIPSSSSSDPYFEAIASYVSTTGSVYNFYGFARGYNNTHQNNGFLNNSSGVGKSDYTILLGTDGLENFTYGGFGFGNLGALSILNSSTFASLLPTVTLISIFSGNTSTNQKNFNNMMDSMDKAFHFTLSKIFVLTLNNATSGPLTLYIYGSDVSFQSFSRGFVNDTLTGFSSGGLITDFEKQISSGSTVPGSNSSRVSGSVFFASYMNMAHISSLGQFNQTSANLSFGASSFAMVGGITVNNYQYHSSTNYKNISLADTLSYEKNMNFQSGASGSVVLLSAPYGYNVLGQRLQAVNVTGFMTNSTVLGLLPFNMNNVSALNTSIPSAITPSSMSVVTNWTYPHNITIKPTMNKLASGRIEVNLTVTNNENFAIRNLKIEGSSLITQYGARVINASGSQNFTLQQLSAGQSRTFTYSFMPSNPGVYSLPYVGISYTEFISSLNKNVTLNLKYPGSSVYVPPGNFFIVINEVEYTSLSALSNISSFFIVLVTEIFPGFYVFDLIFALIVVLDVWIEWRAYKKFKENRK